MSQPTSSPRRRWTRRRTFAASFAGGLLLVTCARGYLLLGARGAIYYNVAPTPERPVGIVFGAAVYPGGQLSPVLQARVEAGIELYQMGKVKKLLMTGDNSRQDYDEVSAMKSYAVSRGVPPADVIRDFAGFRTFDSCVRARQIFQVRSATLITQAYHLPRALFLARHAGIDCDGFAAQPGVDSPTLARFELRESAASVGAILDAALPGRHPHFLGREEPIFGSERADR